MPSGTPGAVSWGGIEKQCAVRNRSVRLHPIAHPDLFAGIRDVQVLFVRQKTDAVRPRKVLNYKLELVPCGFCARLLLPRCRNAIDTVDLQLLLRIVAL